MSSSLSNHSGSAKLTNSQQLPEAVSKPRATAILAVPSHRRTWNSSDRRHVLEAHGTVLKPLLHTIAALILLATCQDTLIGKSNANESVDTARLPNVVIVLADDLGYADLRCCGSLDMQTPHLDKLMSEGMQFTNFYANCPVCSPTRAALLTGRYQDMVGVPGAIRTHAENSWGYLTPQAQLLPKLLKQRGYVSCIIGKWHLGLESPNTPLDRGFDEFHGFLGDMMDDYYTHRRHDINYMRSGNVEIAPQGHATDLFTDWACDFIERRKGAKEPFLMYLAYNAPHTPIQPPDDWLAKVRQREPQMSEKRAKLVALIEHMDHGFGKVMAALDASRMRDNTIVIFSSDNGGQLDVGANNGPLRDGKQSVYEGGLKVPGCVRWPGHVAAGSQSDFRVMSMDIYPTLAEVLGLQIDHEIDGRSFLPTLLGKDQPQLREYWFFRRREGGVQYGGKTIEAVRWGDWKLLQNSPFGPLELYNLQDDPLEQFNLIEKRRDIWQKLAAAQRAEIQRYGTIPWQKPIDAPASSN